MSNNRSLCISTIFSNLNRLDFDDQNIENCDRVY